MINLADYVANKYISVDIAQYLAVAVRYGEGLGLALYPKTYETIKNITYFHRPECRGKNARLVITITNATAYTSHAVKIYPLSFSEKDIKNEVARLKELKAQGLIKASRNNGEVFEAWVIAELGGQGNNRMNASKTECGDCRLDGLDIQIKYHKSGLEVKI